MDERLTSVIVCYWERGESIEASKVLLVSQRPIFEEVVFTIKHPSRQTKRRTCVTQQHGEPVIKIRIRTPTVESLETSIIDDLCSMF